MAINLNLNVLYGTIFGSLEIIWYKVVRILSFILSVSFIDSSAVTSLVASGETLTIEFKGGSIDQDALAEAVICLANAVGGTLFLGVADSGDFAGINPDKRDYADPLRLKATILAHTEPPVEVDVEPVTVENHLIAVITVPTSTSVHATSKGRYLRRSIDVKGKPQCLPMRPHEVLSTAVGEAETSQPRFGRCLQTSCSRGPDRTRDQSGDGQLKYSKSICYQPVPNSIRSLNEDCSNPEAKAEHAPFTCPLRYFDDIDILLVISRTNAL